MPVNEIAQLLAANQRYVSGKQQNALSARPIRQLAIVTCMDVRIEPLAIFGLSLGEAHVIRNAGGRVTDDTLRSLALSAHVLGVRTVVVMQHTKCGLAGVGDAELQHQVGEPLQFHAISDHAEALRVDIDTIVETDYLHPVAIVAGLLYDVETGLAEEVVLWERAD